MARKKLPPISNEDREIVGATLRELRRAAGYRSVETAARTRNFPASRQTIYTYERGEATPSLPQFLDLVEFYVLRAPAKASEPNDLLRIRGVAAVSRALALPLYHVTRARDLVDRMQPDPRGTS
jgi:transcriptional regulator with XRE-family HTH domain